MNINSVQMPALPQKPMSPEDTSRRKDTLLSCFIASYFFVQALNLLMKLLELRLSWWNTASRAALGLLLLFCLPTIISRTKYMALLSELLVLIAFAFSYFLDLYDTVDLEKLGVDALLVFVPMAITAYTIEDYSILRRVLQLFSIFTHLILYYLAAQLISSTSTYNGYSMSLGYALTLQMLIMVDLLLGGKKMIALPFVIADFFLVFLLGSRGPLLCISFFFLLRIMFTVRTSKSRAIVLFFGLLVITGLYLLMPTILEAMQSLSRNLIGRTSRTLQKIMTGNLTENSGRDELYSATITMIKARPLVGWGVGGWPNGLYPHNIALEFLLSFGCPFGAVLIILLIRTITRALKTKDSDMLGVVLIMLAFSMQLIFSGTFLTTPSFFILVMLGLKPRPTPETNTGRPPQPVIMNRRQGMI